MRATRNDKNQVLEKLKLQPEENAQEMVKLLSETRAALAHLRSEELEALALRAETMLAKYEGPSTRAARAHGMMASELAREQMLLGDLLAATSENLRVLRRVSSGGEGNSRWVR